ncbi:MAG: hypothetical protein IV086_13560 [Hyphomonadaceae bacterium]|nr:MAG: hypothetical protein FD160_1932 [Caulobacteraceae bacterium]MBT9446722.1 hypothetical protein [Hyphomonadaceae bacterium]TPW06769.1 MAG: hypothetical protein FD124_1569 [Alphaproteobacteria bacterium]
MFVGHYGPAFAVKAAKRPPSLGAAFLAVQLVDVAWAIFVMTGIEYGRIEPGFMALSALRLDYMPWTHSLPGALAWSLAGMIVYRVFDPRGGWGAAMLIGLCVFSHWVLDFLVHAPDLPLTFNGMKVGLGWWDIPALGVGAEAIVLFVGFFLYLGATKPIAIAGRIAPWALITLFCGLYAFDKLGPAPANLKAAAPMALGAYLVIVALGFLLDRTRVSKSALQAKA